MRKRLAAAMAGLLAIMMVIPTLVFATSVEHLNLEDMSAKADKIFRGTVISIAPGTVEAGGAELPTVTYTLKVDESFKGEYIIEKDDIRLVKVTMITDAKADPSSSGVRKLGFFRDVPQLTVGGDYLLFTSAESSIGLSTTIGLGQGCFDVSGGAALNRAGNVGLFQNAATAGPAKGPLAYDDLSSRIRSILATQ
ncbi:MAG: hypothetical protein ACR2QT_04760 [Woeseiaceae bacterium]